MVLDREMGEQYNEDGDALMSFVVTATDQGIPPRMVQTTVSCCFVFRRQ